MNDTNIIIAALGGGRTTVTASRFMEDYGQVLKITGVELPDVYQVDFANSPHDGNSVTMVGNADGVLIPRQFFDTGQDVYAFLFITRPDAGRTMATIRIPNKRRPHRTNEEPTPEEQSVIDQCISALNEAVAQTAQDVESADQSAQSAQGYAEQAEQARDTAQTYANNAQTSATSAQTSASQASASATSAAQSAQQASASAGTASAAANNAAASASSAATSAERAEQSAAQSGYLWFYIEDGKLYMDRTQNTHVDFYMQDGKLYVEEIA